MMWPILAKVQYERLPRMLSYKHVYRQVFTSLVLNWLVGPFVRFSSVALARSGTSAK